jgi:hypothetical protein
LTNEKEIVEDIKVNLINNIARGYTDNSQEYESDGNLIILFYFISFNLI